RLEATVRLLDGSFRLSQYLLKQTIDPIVPALCRQPVVREAVQQRAGYLNGRRPELYELAIYFVLVYETPTSTQTRSRLQRWWSAPRRATKEWLSTTTKLTLLETELERAMATLHDTARTVEIQLSDFGPERLAKADAFRFFRKLVNVNGAAAAAGSLLYDTHLDYFLGDSAIECHRDHLVIGDQLVKVLSMKEPPSRTFAHVLGDLHRVPREFIVCLD